jgi:hypothetical protein
MKYSGTLLTCCIFCIGISGNCQESASDSIKSDNKSITYGFETDINSKYLWRGIDYNDGLVIQPNLWVSYRNFTAGLWGNLTAYDRHHSTKHHEIDLLLTYTYSIGRFEIDHTVMLYYYPGQEDSPPTGEFYTGIGYPIGDFTLFSNITVDFLTYAGALYFEHGIEYERVLSDRFTLSTSGLLGWASAKFNDTYIGLSKTTFNQLGINVDLTYKLHGPFYVKPHFQMNRIIDKELVPFLGKYPWFCGVLIGIEI